MSRAAFTNPAAAARPVDCPSSRRWWSGLAAAYAAGWLMLALAALAGALLPAARVFAHHAVGLALHARLRPAPSPSAGACVAVFAANVRATCWPLIPATLNPTRSTGLRRLVDVAVLAGLAVNVLPVGVALGVYRLRLVPFVPQLPLELYAITTGPAGWWLRSRQRIGRRQLALIAGTVLIALVGAAVLETWVVPHR